MKHREVKEVKVTWWVSGKGANLQSQHPYVSWGSSVCGVGPSPCLCQGRWRGGEGVPGQHVMGASEKSPRKAEEYLRGEEHHRGKDGHGSTTQLNYIESS